MITTSNEQPDDIQLDTTLRPQKFEEYVGQEKVKKNLDILIQAAKARKEAIEHVLLYGPAGLGKTTLANIIAKELGVGIKTTSGPAIERARANVALNGFDAARTTMLDADVNGSLRQFIKEGRRFDAIVLDPPKFAPSAAHADRASRAYKDINRLAFKLLEPGGVLFTYSCSGGIGAELFHKIVASAGTDAGVDGYISERMQGAPDHPMTLVFPEGEYLKGLVVIKAATLRPSHEDATIAD